MRVIHILCNVYVNLFNSLNKVLAMFFCVAYGLNWSFVVVLPGHKNLPYTEPSVQTTDTFDNKS